MHGMQGIFFTGIRMGGVLLIVITLGLLLMFIIRALGAGGIFRRDKQADAEEARMIQEIFNGLSRMEERVEALETILSERRKKDTLNDEIL